MQNRNPNIDERLQILNDYIQRTIDALNVTRQVAQGLVQSQIADRTQGTVPGGLSHTNYVPQQVLQTPYGFVTVSPVQQFAPQMQQQFVPQFPGFGYGLNHTQFVPQMQPQFVPQIQQWPMQLGYGQVGFNYGLPQWNVGGLSHTPWNPQVVGFGYNQVVPNWVTPNFGAQTITPNVVGTQTITPNLGVSNAI